MRTTFAVACVVAMLCVPTALAENYYVNFGLGLNQTDDTDFNVDIGGPGRIDTDFDNGLNLFAAFGYEFESIRLEGELMLREADVDTHALNGGAALAGSDGELSSTTLMANVAYDFNRDASVNFFAGGGLGFSQVDFSDFGVTGLPNVLDDDDTVLAFQVFAGIDVDINEQWAFIADVRYFQADDPEVTTGVDGGGTTTDASYATTDLNVGLRVRF